MVKAKMSRTTATTVRFGYDGDGRRVWKAVCPTTADCDAGTAGATVTVFAYDVGGALLAEYGSSSTSGTAAGAGWKYLVADHLGSTRMAFGDGAGTVERSDYMPFGEETARGTAVAERVKFTGQQREIASWCGI